MSTTQAPGVYVNEVVIPPGYTSTNADITSFTACFVGWHTQGPTAPTLVTSWSNFTSLYGSFSALVAPTDLAIGVYTYFLNGGNECYVVRVLGTGAVSASNALLNTTPTMTINVAADNPGTWGASVSVTTSTNADGTFNILVFQNSVLKERWNNLSMVMNSAGYFAQLINNPVNGSNYISVTDITGTLTTPGLIPTVQTIVLGTGTNSTAGANGTAATPTQLSAATALLDLVPQPLLINLPNVNSVAVITAFVSYVTNTRINQNCVVYIDTPLPVNGVSSTTAALVTYVASMPVSTYATMFGPCLVITDPTTSSVSANRVVPACAAVLGVTASMDSTFGVAQPTAGTASVLSALALERTVTQTDLATLNNAQINAIRFLQGTGFVIWGANTLSNVLVNEYLSIRRTLIYIETTLRHLTNFAPFQNNNFILWNSITQTCVQWLTTFWASGGMAGVTVDQAFTLVCDSTNNSSSSSSVVITVGVALQSPAVFITFTISQGVTASTVTES